MAASRPRNLREMLRLPRNLGDAVFQLAVFLMAGAILAIIVLLGIEIFDGASLGLSTYGFGFLIDSNWDPVNNSYGSLPAVFGTVTSSLLALAIAGPLGLFMAIFLAELAPPWIERPLSFLVELLASIPSVVIGLWGLFVIVPLLRDPIEKTLHDKLGFLPIFDCTPLGLGMLAAVVILAIMILPYAAAVARDSLRAVPASQREASLALGATQWETIWNVVAPYARSGIVGGLLLALGRAVGETMAVTMVIGNRPDVSACLFNPAYTLASQIANEFAEATSPIYVSVLIELGLVLFAVTLIMNAIARLLLWRLNRQAGSHAE